MAVRRVRLRRGTTAENNAYTGVIGEVTVDTEKKTLHVHDGTAGGESLLRSDLSNNASIATDINFTNANRTIGALMTDDGAQDPTPTVLTLGGAGSKVVIAGSLEVTGNTTQAQSLLVESRVIQIADGAEADGANTNDVGIFFTRTDNADKGLFFWDEAGDTFKLGLDGNNLAPTATDFDTDDVNYTPASLSLGSLNVNDGNITNVADIALDTISADGNTIGMTLKQAGGATAFTIVDDNQAGTGVATFLTIDATDGTDSVTIDSTNFVVNSSSISLDNSVVINETGADKDFRVEGIGKANALFVQGSDGFVGLNKAAPTVQLDVVGDALITGSTTLEGAVVINDTGADVDFRVEGNTDANLLHVDASADAVGISTATPSKTLDVAGTFGVSSKSTLAGSLDLTTGSSDGITFRSEIVENGADADATLLRVNIGGTDGAGNPNYKAVSWVAVDDTFSFDGSAKILDGALVLGDGTNATTISVVDQSGGGNTLGEHLTISAGKGQGTEAGGSIIFQTQSAAGGALTTVLTLDKDNKATFTGNIDFSDGTVLGASVVDGDTLTLGGHTGSTVTTAGNLTVTSDLTVNGTGATALDFTDANITIGGSATTDTNTITIGGGAITKTAGVLTVGGNQIKDDSGDTVITFSNDGNLTATFAGNIATTTTLTAGTDLTVSGGDITLGAAGGGATTISVPTTNLGGAGHSLTLSSGVGSAGDGSNDGSLILRSGTTAVLTLDTAEKATFAGNIDFSDGTVLGASVVDGDTMTLGGHAGSTVITSGHLRVTSGQIQAPDGNSTSITIDNDDNVTVGGNLQVTGNIIQNAQSETTITLSNDQSATVENNLTVSGGLITLANGMSIDSTVNGTLTLTEPVVATSAALKVGNGSIQNGGGIEAIALTNNNLTTTITGTTTILSNNLQINGTSIASEAAADVLTVFNNNTGGITLGNTGAITLGSAGGSTTVGGALTVNGTGATALDFTDASITIGGSTTTGTNIITIGGGAITETGGVLRVGGNVIQASDGANTISIDANNDLVTFLGDIKVSGDTIQSSTAEAIQLSADDVTVIGDLNITGTSSQKVNLGATDESNAFEIAVQPRTGGGVEADNKAGANLTVSSGASTGKGTGGSIFFKTPRFNSENIANGTDLDNNVVNPLDTVLELDRNKLAQFAGAVTIAGDLTVNGTTTTIDSTISTYADPMIHLNKDGLENSDLGVYMSVNANDNEHQNLAMYWDDAQGSFTFASTTADLGDGGGAVNLSAGADYRLESVLAKGLTLDGASLQVGDSTGVADAFVVASTGVLTSKNTATFDVDSTDALVVSTALGADVFLVDTTNSHVETRHIMPLADSTYDLGTDGLRFREGFFDTINVGTGVTNAGTNTFSNATPISITSAGTNGITFRSDIADQGDDGNATLLRVNIGGAGPAFKKIHWVAATDDFSVESGLISEGDFTVGASKFVVTASSGATSIAGDLDYSTAGDWTIGASVGNAETLILGGASSTTKTAGGLQVVGNIDFSTDANRTIGNALGADTVLTLGGAATSITEVGILRLLGNKIQSADGGEILVLTDAGNVTVENDLTVTNDLTVSGNTLTYGNGAIIENTGVDVLTITEATVVIDGNMTLNGTDLLADNAGEARNIFTSTTGTISVGSSTSTVSVGNTLNVVGTEVNLSSNQNNVDTEIKVVDRSGGDDLVGNDLTISAGASTGTGAGGSLIFQTSITGLASNAITNATQEVLKLDTSNLATFGGNIQINGTDISSEAAADVLTLFSNNTGGITLGNSGAITLGNGAGSTVVGNTLQINGASIVADVVGEARNIFATTTGLITLGGDGIVAVGGDLKVTGNGIQTGGNNEAITFVDDNSTLTLTASDTTTISATNTVTSGDLTVEGRDIILGTATGGATTISVPDQTDENTAGHQLTISAGAGKGSGAGGSILFQTAEAGVADAGAGTLATALTIDSTKTATFAADISVATTSLLSGNVTFGGDLVGSVVGDARNIFTTTTGTITIGASNSTVVSGGNLKLATNIIENSDGETTITLDANQGVTITGLANGTSSLTLTNGDLEILNGGITTDAINGKVQFNDPNLYVGLGNSLNNRDVGVVGAYGDSNNSEFLSGSVYKPSATVGGKGGEFFLFEGKNKTEANAYTVADDELAGLQVGNVRSVGTQTNGLITTLADSATLGDHHIVIVTGDNKTVTLPDATAAGMTGRRYIIKDNNAAQDGSADHDTLIVSNGGGIDGSTAGNGIALRSQYAMVEVVSNGTQWFIIAESGTVTRL